MIRNEPKLPARCLAEVLGTFILVFFGCGVVHAAVLTGAQVGLWQVAVVWGSAVAVAIYVVGGVSGAHINPAVTVALVFFRRFPAVEVVPYVASQLAGGFLAAAVVFAIFDPFLREKEEGLQVRRGEPGSVFTAMGYGEYFPNPGLAEKDFKNATPGERNRVLDRHFSKVPQGTAFLAELIGTLLLGMVVLAVTDERNQAAPLGRMAPAFIGLTVAILISVLAPVTQACFNPARDFGPRLFAFTAGWGEVALPGPNGLGVWTVYLLAPVLGATAGAALYTFLVRPALPSGVEPLDAEKS